MNELAAPLFHKRYRTTLNSTALALLLAGILLGAWLTTVQAASSPYRLSQSSIGSCDTAVTIMPLGDSITQGKSSGVADESGWIAYRKDLWDSLIANGYNVDFVGSNLNGQVYPGFDADHQGEGGVTSKWVANRVYNFLTAHPADVVLLHIGTNWVANEDPESTVNVEKILTEIDRYENDNNRAVTVILARIINRIPYNQTTTNYNNNVAAMAQARIDNGDKIILVDMENGAGIIYQNEPTGDMYINLHPYTTGYAKMAAVWYSTLTTLLPPCVPSSPNINPINNATAYTNTLYQYQVVATGSPAPTFSLLVSPGGMTINSSTGLIAWTPTTSQAGQHTVTVKATNSVGSDTKSFTIEVLKPALTVTVSPGSQLINSGSTAGFTVAISNTGGVTLSVVVAAPQAPSCQPAQSPSILAPSQSLNYTCTKSNVTQDFTNVITATGTFTPPTSGPISVVASGAAFVDVRPTIAVQQIVGPTSLPEPGGLVSVSLTINNTSQEPVTLTTLATTPFGDVTNPANGLITATSCAKVTIGSGGQYNCSFSAPFSGQPGEYNLVTTVKGKDNEGNEAIAVTSSPLAITNLASSIEVTLTAVPFTIPEPGGTANFTVTVTNTSPSDSVVINSLNDQLLGSLNGQGSCSLPTNWLAPGSVYQCTFTAMISGVAGEAVTNQVAASGMDDDSNLVSGSSAVSTVAINDKTTLIFLPFITMGN